MIPYPVILSVCFVFLSLTPVLAAYCLSSIPMPLRPFKIFFITAVMSFSSSVRTVIGYLGEVHPEVCDNYDLGTRAYVAVLDMPVIEGFTTFDRKYVGIAKFPAVKRDISMVVPKEILVGSYSGNFFMPIQSKNSSITPFMVKKSPSP